MNIVRALFVSLGLVAARAALSDSTLALAGGALAGAMVLGSRRRARRYGGPMHGRPIARLFALALLLCGAMLWSTPAEAETILRTRAISPNTIAVEAPPNAILPYPTQFNEFGPIWGPQFPPPGSVPTLQSSLIVVPPSDPAEGVSIEFRALWPQNVSQAKLVVGVTQGIPIGGLGKLIGVGSTPTSATSADNVLVVRFQFPFTPPPPMDIQYDTRTDVLIPGMSLASTSLTNVLNGSQSQYHLEFLISKPADLWPLPSEPFMRLTFVEVSTPLDAIYVPEPGSWALLVVGGVAIALRRTRQRRIAAAKD